MSAHILASLNYLGQMHEKPAFHVFDTSRHNLNLVPHTVSVGNARCRPEHASLDKEGFCLVQHRTSVAHLESRREVLRVYRPEIEALVAQLTGAALAIAEPIGVVRVASNAAPPPRVLTHAPLKFVHTDFTLCSALDLVHRLLHASGIEFGVSGSRCIVYNVWRSLTPPPQDVPLALCDLRTMDPQDAVAADSLLDFPGSRSGTTETTLFRFNERHKWYYYPRMTRDEVLIFKSFDSHAEHGARVPHSAFEDPTCDCGAPARASLDLRVVAVF
jgi:hypothetical protein